MANQTTVDSSLSNKRKRNATMNFGGRARTLTAMAVFVAALQLYAIHVSEIEIMGTSVHVQRIFRDGAGLRREPSAPKSSSLLFGSSVGEGKAFPVPGSSLKSNATSEYGDIVYRHASERQIQEADSEDFEKQRRHIFETLSTESLQESYWGYAGDDLNPKNERFSPKWTYTTKPNCNAFHEQPWSTDVVAKSTRYLGSGYYRDTFLLSGEHVGGVTVVKRQRQERDWDRNREGRARQEALIMERLTNSPRISDVHGYCAFSLAVEPAPVDLFKKTLAQTDYMYNYGVVQQSDLDWRQRDNVMSLNNWTNIEKVDLLLQIAGSLADIQGIETGPILLGDVSLSQWLGTSDGRVVLNDFDNAAFMDHNATHYLPHESSYVGGLKAPEEVNGPNFIEEKVDSWKLGGLIFSMISGLLPYYDDEHHLRHEERDAKILMGRAPYLDPRFREKSRIERRLVDLMNLCFRVEPSERISVFDAVAHLRETKSMNDENN